MSLGNNSISVVLGENTYVLSKINQDNFGSRYYSYEGTFELTANIRHSQEALQADGTRFDRHNVELIHTVFPTDTVPGKTRVSYIIIRNLRSDDHDEVADDARGLLDFVGSTNTLNQLLGWMN